MARVVFDSKWQKRIGRWAKVAPMSPSPERHMMYAELTSKLNPGDIAAGLALAVKDLVDKIGGYGLWICHRYSSYEISTCAYYMHRCLECQEGLYRRFTI
jgi:hypothetical protein